MRMRTTRINPDAGERVPVRIDLPPGHARRVARRADAKSDKRISMVVEQTLSDLSDPVMFWLVDQRLPTQYLRIGTQLADRIEKLKLARTKRQRQHRKWLYAHIATTFDYAIAVRDSTVLFNIFKLLPETLALARPPATPHASLGAMLQLTMNNHNDASAAKKRIEHLWNTGGASGADVYQFLVAQKLKPTVSKPTSRPGQPPAIIAPSTAGVQQAEDAAVAKSEDHSLTASNDTPKSSAEVSELPLTLRFEGSSLKQDHLAALKDGATVSARIVFCYDSTKRRQVAKTRYLSIT